MGPHTHAAQKSTNKLEICFKIIKFHVVFFSTPLERSPYMQKLAHTHVVPTQSGSGGRPMSAKSGGGKTRPISGASDYGMAQNGKQKIDSKFIADPTLWEPASPPSDRRRNRPSSAPSMKRYHSFPHPTSSLSLSFFFCIPSICDHLTL